MFYSHTVLARKGPLGTVWCAAHLQHKLKKSQYTSTDIPSTVERIMFPEVPIALRMSSHLLLGVVRIYSKKVQYLYNDCNVFLMNLRNTCPLVDVNLPEGATHAPFHSVTLPDTFELDALDLDYDFYEGDQDKYLKSFDEITLSCDQIPTGTDPYIAINLDEDLLRRSSNIDDPSGLGPEPMQEEDAPSETMSRSGGFRNPSPRPIDDNSPKTIPEFEVLRDATVWPDPQNNVLPPDTYLEEQIVKDTEPPPENIPEIEVRRDATVWSDPQEDVLPPDTYLEEQIVKDKEASASFLEELPTEEQVPITPFQGPVTSPVSDHVANLLFSNNSIGLESLNLALNPSPLVDEPKGKQPINKPNERPRKRKQRFDKDMVLTNKVMKAALDNRDDILRKRKYCPSSDFDVWKSNNKLRKEKMFSEPLITGLPENLRGIFDVGVISKPHLLPDKDAREEPSSAQLSHIQEANLSPSPRIQVPMNADHEETEILRNYDGPVCDNITPDGIIHNTNSSPREDEFTPGVGSSIGSPQTGTIRETASTGTVVSDWETSFTSTQEKTLFDNTGLSPIPEDNCSAEVDELNFLASEDPPEHTPRKFQGTEGFSSLSGATRKVAQFLKEKSSPISEDVNGDLSLNQLLEGKTRKVAARMLFETLVLKSGGYVDLQQEKDYGDIKLQLTPKLFKDQY